MFMAMVTNKRSLDTGGGDGMKTVLKMRMRWGVSLTLALDIKNGGEWGGGGSQQFTLKFAGLNHALKGMNPSILQGVMRIYVSTAACSVLQSKYNFPLNKTNQHLDSWWPVLVSLFTVFYIVCHLPVYEIHSTAIKQLRCERGRERGCCPLGSDLGIITGVKHLWNH